MYLSTSCNSEAGSEFIFLATCDGITVFIFKSFKVQVTFTKIQKIATASSVNEITIGSCYII
jgi:hypothetical protein